jgi:hypothetical protein
MVLNETDRQKIVEWLNAKCGQMRCTCCGFGKWEVVGMATLPIVIDLHTTRFFYSQGIPQVAILCTNCGHMIFFNPAIMGFKPDQPPAAELSSQKESA